MVGCLCFIMGGGGNSGKCNSNNSERAAALAGKAAVGGQACPLAGSMALDVCFRPGVLESLCPLFRYPENQCLVQGFPKKSSVLFLCLVSILFCDLTSASEGHLPNSSVGLEASGSLFPTLISLLCHKSSACQAGRRSGPIWRHDCSPSECLRREREKPKACFPPTCIPSPATSGDVASSCCKVGAESEVFFPLLLACTASGERQSVGLLQGMSRVWAEHEHSSTQLSLSSSGELGSSGLALLGRPRATCKFRSETQYSCSFEEVQRQSGRFVCPSLLVETVSLFLLSS